ncbi:MAG: class I fructose-bisphosphate aldolase [Planctomycetota bacterium]|jgi:class I fructose-bisphosphate aldolase
MGKGIAELLGDEAKDLLEHACGTVPKGDLNLPGPDFIDRVWASTDRNNRVLGNLAWMFSNGRLGGTGYLSVLPVDQGIEHTAGASFAPNPAYFDPENIVKLAIEGGCNAVASTLGVLGAVARKYAHKIPFILKFRQIEEVTEAFQAAHELGLATVLWCYLRNSAFKTDKDYHLAADLTGQANYLGVTIEADIVKQKQPENNGGFTAINFGRSHPLMYEKLITDHPIDLTRWQVVNCYMGRVGLINSGGASGKDDLKQAVRTAVINKRAGGTGLISGRKAFQKPMADGVKLLNAIQDVYLDESITVA